MNNPDSNSQLLSPLRAQPLKKQRGGSTPDILQRSRQGLAAASSVNETAQDAIARRRAELRRLQAQREARAAQHPQLAAAAAAPPHGGPPPAPPKPKHVARHHSDLFPAVQKSPAREKKAVPDLAKPHHGVTPKLPPLPDVTMPDKRSRAKSAPPVRPPPPPPPPGGEVPQEAPPTSSASGTSTASRGPPLTASRPPPMSPGSLLQPTSSTTMRVPTPPPTPPPAVGVTPLLTAPKWTEKDGKIVELSPATVKPLPGVVLPPKPPHLPRMDRTPRKPEGEVAAPEKTTSKSSSSAPMKSSPPAVAPEDTKPPATTMTPATPTVMNPSEDAPTPLPVSTPAMPTSAASTSSSSRRERLSQMREGLTTTATSEKKMPPPLVSATAQRLEETLKQTMQEKRQALQKIAQLETELLEQTRKQQAIPPPPKPLQQMLQISKAQGEMEAWKWAKSQVVGLPPLSNSSNVGGSPQKQSATAFLATSATAAPQPKLPHLDAATTTDMVQLERQQLEFFRQAVECVASEYESPLASYVVRRPYGFETLPRLLWASVGAEEDSAYAKKAHISTVSTLQVAGTLQESGSHFLLSGLDELTYQVDEDDWKTVSASTTPFSLGVVTYIDNEGLEKDWSISQLLQEALQVRQDYAKTMMATALGFAQRLPAPPELVDGIPPSKSDMGVDTSDMNPPPVESVQIVEKMTKETVVVEKETKVAAAAPPQDDESGSSGNVLAIFLGMIFQSIFGLIYWILIGLPLAIVRTSIVTVCVVAILSMAYLQLLDQYHNGQALSMLSSPSGGGYHSNTIGIL